MKVHAQIDDKQIEGMDLSITFTMTVREWRELMSQQERKWPSWKIGEMIAEVIGHISRATNSRFSTPRELRPEEAAK